MPVHEHRVKQSSLTWAVSQSAAALVLTVLLAASCGHTQGTGSYGSEFMLSTLSDQRVDTSDRVRHPGARIYARWAWARPQTV
jgi:hypothetical protein